MRSARRLVKLLLQEDSEILPKHREECLGIALWKITEAESEHKHRTRLCSETVYESPLTASLRHEHVYRKKHMIQSLIKSRPEDVDRILDLAVGCTVTIEEHILLHKYEDKDGWERYKAAGIAVIDACDGRIFEFPDAS